MALIAAASLWANGVAIVNATTGVYFKCTSSSVSVSCENQAAITKTTQEFINTTGAAAHIKYGFPLPEQASALQLRWKIYDQWHIAGISAKPQDTTMPGGGQKNVTLSAYVGKTPLYFDISQVLSPDSMMTIELTYAEFLPYENGLVAYIYPNDYHLIQASALVSQHFDFTLVSARTITAINLQSNIAASTSNSGNKATVTFSSVNSIANANYSLIYSLSLNQLGLFSLSTRLPDSLVPDNGGKGYFLFVAEPNPADNAKVIKKVFTLIIDRSGSMAGAKIEQARGAATFIVNNLNAGDKFNIIDFDNIISSFKSTHVDFTSQNQTAALSYINTLTSRGNTDIAGAFDTAISQFSSSASDSTANIIIFFTDGQPTAGITTSDGILQEISASIAKVNKKISIFTFGVGGDVNQQLLSQIAQQNSGLAEFLGNDQLESRVTSFYLKIRNPVLLKTSASFSPDIITEVFPVALPNLYKGQQMILVGRYASAVTVTATFRGEAFGTSVSYQYPVTLADTMVDTYFFLPKLWAKRKIDNLYAIYCTLSSSSSAANEYKSEITTISVKYGIISPFTSFSGGNLTGIFKENGEQPFITHNQNSVLKTSMHNGMVRFTFQAQAEYKGIIRIKIFNLTGRLIKALQSVSNASGKHEILWDGIMDNGLYAPNGFYYCAIEINGKWITANLSIVR
jgi:Ca-activated chloride channel family protein